MGLSETISTHFDIFFRVEKANRAETISDNLQNTFYDQSRVPPSGRTTTMSKTFLWRVISSFLQQKV